MSTCNSSDITYLSEQIDYLYHNFVKVQFFMGGLILISTFSSIIQNSNIITKLNEIKNIVVPPIYKSSDVLVAIQN